MTETSSRADSATTAALPPLLADVVDEAIGRRHRDNPVTPQTGGPAGNARMTAWLGAVLLVVIAAETVTLLDVRGLVGWHVGFGVVLVGLTLAKTAATGWRVIRYYSGNPLYRTAGPPSTLLRLLGPLLVASSLGVLGSGLALLALGPGQDHAPLLSVVGQRIDPVTVHQLFFIAFAVAVSLHVLARAVPAWQRITAGDHTPGRTARAAVVAAALLAGTLAALLLAPASWR